MSDLLFWFLVSQTLTGLPQMPPGTEVQLASRDLLTLYATARVEDGRLEFSAPLSPGQELRLLIFPPNLSDQERVEALGSARALPGTVSADGQDILVHFPDLDGPVSMRKWLAEEREILLVMPLPADGRRSP